MGRWLSSGRVPSFASILLLTQLFQEYNQNGIPPMTLAAIVGQILIYFRCIPIFWSSSISESCLSASKIIYYKDYEKLFISQVEHGDDWHLYYNMASFLVKGKHLEGRLGSGKYFVVLLTFIGMTGLTYICLNYVIAEIFEDESYMNRCAVGFSGVIFALKVLTTHDLRYERVQMSIAGIPLGASVSAKNSVWFELILISLVTPNASFVGHLAGILVGIAYVYGPLKHVVEFIHGIASGGVIQNPLFVPAAARFTQTSQPTGYRRAQPPPTRARTFLGPTMREEQVRNATEESIRTRRLQPNLDEIRRRRINFYASR